MDSLGALLKKEGCVILSTINRTRRSYLFGILAAEYLLRWVPAGTHDWDRFVKPSEIVAMWDKVNIEPVDMIGLVYKPLSRKFTFSQGNVSVNYFISGRKS